VIQAASGKAEEWPIPGLYRPRRQRRRSSSGRPGSGAKAPDAGHL